MRKRGREALKKLANRFAPAPPPRRLNFRENSTEGGDHRLNSSPVYHIPGPIYSASAKILKRCSTKPYLYASLPPDYTFLDPPWDLVAMLARLIGILTSPGSCIYSAGGLNSPPLAKSSIRVHDDGSWKCGSFIALLRRATRFLLSLFATLLSRILSGGLCSRWWGDG